MLSFTELGSVVSEEMLKQTVNDNGHQVMATAHVAWAES